MRLGFVVNPVAGMGGRVGLKGTDGVLEEAIERGAKPRAPERAREALDAFAARRPDATVFTVAGAMGADAVAGTDLEFEVVLDPDEERSGAGTETGRGERDAQQFGNREDDECLESIDDRQIDVSLHTTGADTREGVRRFLDRDVDLVCFVGGDGTAVDVASVLAEHDSSVPMLGVPAGVKIYSSVFGVTPADAGRIAADFDRVEDREVNDIDEAAYRAGEVRAELKAVVPVPVADGVQGGKQLSGGSVDALAEGFAAEVEPNTTYVFGPGGTVGAIQDALGVDASPLGVDVVRDGRVLVADANEAEILEAMAEPTIVVVSPIGGQGFIFGRGNHQLSPEVIRRAADVVVVASNEKLDQVGVLRVDTDDAELDESLRGWMHVRTGRFTTRLVKVE